MSTIFVSGVEFYGYHGVSDAERALGHRFEVNVEVDAEERASHSDDVADTVDYGAIAAIIVDVGQGPSHRTVERLAKLMADRILAEHPTAVEVEIEISKLLPPAPVVARAAGVRMAVARAQ